MARDTGLIFSLFNVASAWEVPFGVPLFMQCILHGLTFVSHSPLLTTKSVDFVVGTWWFPFVMEIICDFHSDYFDCRGSVCFFLNIGWFVLLYKGLNIASNEVQDEESSFQIIIKITEARGATVCVGSPVIIKLCLPCIVIIIKKLTNKCTKKIEIFN